MSKRSPIVIGDRTFQTQAAAKSFFSTLLNLYGPGDALAPPDQPLLAALLDRHPERAQKVGVGVGHFAVMNDRRGGQCFRVVRTDGTGTDFSYRTCLGTKPVSQRTQVLRALRQAVAADVNVLKRKVFDALKGSDGCIACTATGQRIPWSETAADHRAPATFEQICEDFIAERDLGWEQIKVADSVDDQTVWSLANPQLAEDFRRFHNATADIRLVSATYNLAEGPKHRLRKPSLI